MLTKIIGAGASVAALTVITAFSGQAAPTDFCREYATAAINQVRAALANPGCASVHGPRWIANEGIHFKWCLTQSIPMVESEHGARTAYLRACRGT